MSKLYQQQQNLNGFNMPMGDDDEEMLINNIHDNENEEETYFYK